MNDQDKGRAAPMVGTHGAPSGRSAAPGAPISPGGAPGADLPAQGAGGELGLEDLLPQAIPDGQRRGPGRPKGRANIRTNTTFQVAISRYGDPLIATVALGNMPTRDLIGELRKIAADCGLKLGCTVMDVVRFQEECRRNAMPYGHAKRVAETGAGDPVVPIIGIGSVNVSVDAAAGRSLEDVLDAEIIEQHQGGSDDMAK